MQFYVVIVIMSISVVYILYKFMHTSICLTTVYTYVMCTFIATYSFFVFLVDIIQMFHALHYKH